jgi:ERCC4-related helicase
MTPQTLLNDLTTENCDPRDIVLMVIGTLPVVHHIELVY